VTNNKGQSKTFWDTLTKTKTVSKFWSNHKRGLTIFVGLLGLYFGSIIFYTGNPQENSLDSEELKALVSKTKNSIDTVKKKTDPFIREILIQNEAKKLEIRADEYRKLLDLQKSSSDLLPDVRRDNFLSPIIWFYQDLYPSQRLRLTGGWVLWFFSILPNLTILYVAWKFVQEIPLRERQAKYQAWQVIHTAHGQKFSGARISALEDLVEQGESLSGLVISMHVDLNGINLNGANLKRVCLFDVELNEANLNGANLNGASLTYAKLDGANLEGAKLDGATLNKASLKKANLRNANLNGANLEEAILDEANLKGAELYKANLDGAELKWANLEGVTLYEASLKRTKLNFANLKSVDFTLANLEDVDLYKADLEGAILYGTNLKGTNLYLVNLDGATLHGANLESTENLTREQLKNTYLCSTKLPDGLKDLSNRNCQEDQKEWVKKWREKLKLQKQG